MWQHISPFNYARHKPDKASIMQCCENLFNLIILSEFHQLHAHTAMTTLALASARRKDGKNSDKIFKFILRWGAEQICNSAHGSCTARHSRAASLHTPGNGRVQRWELLLELICYFFQPTQSLSCMSNFCMLWCLKARKCGKLKHG